jgi:hypothetical protein
MATDALILGGTGLVGLAICRKLLREGVQKLIVVCLGTVDEQIAIRNLQQEFPESLIDLVEGNIFSVSSQQSTDLHDLRQSFQGPVQDSVIVETFIYQLLRTHQPTIVIDAINSSSVIAYHTKDNQEDRLVSLVRYFYAFYRSLCLMTPDQRPSWYIKVGTTGTGGLGLNIPFTHGEEQPSQSLLMKSALAGAYSQLLFLLARTPDMPAIREIKPACAIAWKSIRNGPVKRGLDTLMIDHDYVIESLSASSHSNLADQPQLRSSEPLTAPYLDSGENGSFSLEEFRTITSMGLMEYVTPYELAELVWLELNNIQTGRDTIAAQDAAVIPPSYTAGVKRADAIEQLEQLISDNGNDSVAFELLGPPLLSKLLWEAHLIAQHGNVQHMLQYSPERLSVALYDGLMSSRQTLLRILSVGLPIVAPDGTSFLRGSRVAVTTNFSIDPEKVIEEGWVDLRPQNCARWLKRLGAWENLGNTRITPGEIVAWILMEEQGGFRVKR